jgi:hypothetical protein
MDMKVADNNANSSDWVGIFTRLSPDRRSKILARAAHLIADDNANANEQETSRRQLQAALEVDPKLVLDVLAAVRGNDVPNADMEKLKQDAASAQAKFEALANATHTLRTSLTETGIIPVTGDLPETVVEWKSAIGQAVMRETRRFAAKEELLLQRQDALEAKRVEVLAEINAAQNLLQEKAGFFRKLSIGMSPFKTKIAQGTRAISSLSFAFDNVQVPEIGQLVPGEGIFTALWTPKYQNGKPLGIEFELYTSPEDLRFAPGVGGLQTYLNSVRSVAGLKGWHSHDGGNFAHSDEYVSFINRKAEEFVGKNNVASGEWFRPNGLGVWALPPREIVDGKVEDANGNRVKTSDQNHFDLRNTGAFVGTFNTEYNGSDDRHWYWSSTEHRQIRDHVWNVDFRDGGDGWGHKDYGRLSARPVRVGRIRHLTI